MSRIVGIVVLVTLVGSLLFWLVVTGGSIQEAVVLTRSTPTFNQNLGSPNILSVGTFPVRRSERDGIVEYQLLGRFDEVPTLNSAGEYIGKFRVRFDQQDMLLPVLLGPGHLLTGVGFHEGESASSSATYSLKPVEQVVQLLYVRLGKPAIIFVKTMLPVSLRVDLSCEYCRYLRAWVEKNGKAAGVTLEQVESGKYAFSKEDIYFFIAQLGFLQKK